ncbi:MAG TPA: NTP transferase domain-containing protein [Solirubrobacteraceae bacterium]
MEQPPQQPIGVVLAGGLGRRIGGGKPQIELAGQPLIGYPVQALQSVLAEVRVLAKPDTALPALPGVEVWTEPAEPRHPLVGIVQALRLAAPRPVLMAAADMPLLTAAAVAELAYAEPAGAPAVVAARDGALEPLLGRYEPSALALLEPAARQAREPLRAAVAAIGPRLIELAPELLFNVNTAEDLARAEILLSRR